MQRMSVLEERYRRVEKPSSLVHASLEGPQRGACRVAARRILSEQVLEKGLASSSGFVCNIDPHHIRQKCTADRVVLSVRTAAGHSIPAVSVHSSRRS